MVGVDFEGTEAEMGAFCATMAHIPVSMAHIRVFMSVIRISQGVVRVSLDSIRASLAPIRASMRGILVSRLCIPASLAVVRGGRAGAEASCVAGSSHGEPAGCSGVNEGVEGEMTRCWLNETDIFLTAQANGTLWIMSREK